MKTRLQFLVSLDKSAPGTVNRRNCVSYISALFWERTLNEIDSAYDASARITSADLQQCMARVSQGSAAASE